MIRQRDDMDRNRAVAPLKPAADAVIVDTSDLGIEGVLKVLTDTVAASSERIVREVRYCPKDAAEDAVSGMRDAAFSHMAGDGSISMVDVGSKNITRRVAIVRGAVEMNAIRSACSRSTPCPRATCWLRRRSPGLWRRSGLRSSSRCAIPCR